MCLTHHVLQTHYITIPLLCKERNDGNEQVKELGWELSKWATHIAVRQEG
jgi:hypothetical protein